jgi:hypothetical protein
MATANYIIARATAGSNLPIYTGGLTQDVNKYIEKGYEALGGMTIQPITGGYDLFQPMTKKPSQGGGNGTKRRRIRKNVQ